MILRIQNRLVTESNTVLIKSIESVFESVKLQNYNLGNVKI